ncbi:MAG: type II toxin-antitoxin system Phd/YefM family antitoxin [Candidatus Scalindua sp.]
MITLHPSILEQNGKKQFAVSPYEEFLKIQEELSDYEDLKELRQAKKSGKRCSGNKSGRSKKRDRNLS